MADHLSPVMYSNYVRNLYPIFFVKNSKKRSTSILKITVSCYHLVGHPGKQVHADNWLYQSAAFLSSAKCYDRNIYF